MLYRNPRVELISNARTVLSGCLPSVSFPSPLIAHWIEKFVVVAVVDVLILLTCLGLWSEILIPWQFFVTISEKFLTWRDFLHSWGGEKNIKFDPTKPLLKIVLTPQVWLSGRKIIKNVFLDTEEKKAKICWSSWLFDLVTGSKQNSIFIKFENAWALLKMSLIDHWSELGFSSVW